MTHHRVRIFLGAVLITAVGCRFFEARTSVPTATVLPTPASSPTPLPSIPVKPGEANPEEPVLITGLIPYTSPFFLENNAEPFVLLEDQTGFIRRDPEYEFPLSSQAIGPVTFVDEANLRYDLPLPAVPQGQLVDVDNDGREELGVQVFAVSYWSNIWGDPFLEPRDGTGWSNAHSSVITDPDLQGEVVGGILVVWVPDDEQHFPSGFGADGLLFTEDDPVEPIQAGYNIVDLNTDPFQFFKEARPKIDLVEGVQALNDYSALSYENAFETMFEKISREYPFTAEKGVDWDALHDEFAPRVAQAPDAEALYRALRDFTLAIPDRHIAVFPINPQVFFDEHGGSFGLILTELSDGRVLVTDVLPGTQGERAGIEIGAEIISWDGQPIRASIDQAQVIFPHSVAHSERLDKVLYVTRTKPGTLVTVSFQNPGIPQLQQVTMEAEIEVESWIKAISPAESDEMNLNVEAEVLDQSGFGYIRITSFLGDSNLWARLWEYYIQRLIDNEIAGLIIDVRENTGGFGNLALDFAGYFFNEEITLFQRSYYSQRSGRFEPGRAPSRLTPGPIHYTGPIAVLIGPDCVSACESFAHALSQKDRAILVGHYPTAGALGDVGRGQYEFPEDLSLQFPTGRPETLDGELVIEGTGVEPDIWVPVTEDSALRRVDAVLDAAIESLETRVEP